MKRDTFGDCSDLDAIEELECRRSAISGMGGLAPPEVTDNVQKVNRRDSTSARKQGTYDL
jgi:hypothetical protein